MVSDLDIAAFKSRLAGIESEHSARMDVASKKFEESDKATKESHAAFAERKQRLTERLREMGRAQRGDGKEKDRAKELAFGLEDETAVLHDDLAEELAQIEKERQERAMRAQSEAFMRGAPEAPQRQVRQPPAVEQPPTPPPARQAPPPPRRPQRRAVDDDDDFANQSWLS